MPPVRRCTSPRPIRPANLALRGPEDALGVLLAGRPPERPSVSCLLLDDEHQGLTCLEVAGRADADTVLDLAELLVSTAADDTDVAALVLASFRPGASHLPDPGETCCFFELRDLFADVGIELLDWFLVAGGYATSLAELSDAEWLWRLPPAGPPA